MVLEEGRVPPKDQIQEIRINNNPFSSEFSGVGYGRVEIITSPGPATIAGTSTSNSEMNLSMPAILSPLQDRPSQMRNFNSNFQWTDYPQ